MRIEFSAKTNKNYCSVNTAIFHLKNGGTITLDRKETHYSIENENLKMLWKDVYIWCINNECIFDDQTIYSSSGLLRLLKDSWVELKLEDDADEDYKITDIEWIIIDEINYISGTDYPEESGERRMAKGNYLLITTDGYSLDDYTFYDTLEQAQTSMKDSFEKMKPSDWFESDEEMSWLRERDAILYGNGEYVFVWNIIEVTKPII